jgi:hypothetical protein
MVIALNLFKVIWNRLGWDEIRVSEETYLDKIKINRYACIAECRFAIFMAKEVPLRKSHKLFTG